jgi:hypothetical protein
MFVGSAHCCAYAVFDRSTADASLNTWYAVIIVSLALSLPLKACCPSSGGRESAPWSCQPADQVSAYHRAPPGWYAELHEEVMTL